MNFVAREGIFGSLVVSSNSVGVSERFEGSSMLFGSIFVEIAHISFGELTSETSFVIFDFEASELIIVVEDGLLNELRVKHTFKENIEIRHESGMVTELILAEDGNKSIVLLVVLSVFLSDRGESNASLEEGEESATVEETEVTSLKNGVKEVSIRIEVTAIVQVELTPE